ncbi:MAG: hypothetical protein ACYCYK_08505 [Candidatus Dormibacteria bacterium]
MRHDQSAVAEAPGARSAVIANCGEVGSGREDLMAECRPTLLVRVGATLAGRIWLEVKRKERMRTPGGGRGRSPKSRLGDHATFHDRVSRARSAGQPGSR